MFHPYNIVYQYVTVSPPHISKSSTAEHLYFKYKSQNHKEVGLIMLTATDASRTFGHPLHCWALFVDSPNLEGSKGHFVAVLICWFNYKSYMSFLLKGSRLFFSCSLVLLWTEFYYSFLQWIQGSFFMHTKHVRERVQWAGCLPSCGWPGFNPAIP